MERKNILVEGADGTWGTMSGSGFYITVCRGHVEPILRLLNGEIYQDRRGNKYCIKADDFELDKVAEAWISVD